MGKLYGAYVPTIIVDFDGVIHSYASPWKNAWTIPDPPVEGAIDWLMSFGVPDAIDAFSPPPLFQIAILSSRSKYPLARWCMKRYLLRHGVDPAYFRDKYIVFPRTKPGAVLSLDDRAMCFTGAFPSPDEIKDFKPWNHSKRQEMKAYLDRLEEQRIEEDLFYSAW